jgi:adenylate cyclase
MKNQRLLIEINNILGDISAAVNAERTTFFILNQETSELESVIAQGLDNIVLTIPVGQGIAGSVARLGQGVIINNVKGHPLFDSSFDKQLGFETRSALCVPIFNVTNEVIGVVQCLNKTTGDFDQKDLLVLKGFGATMSLIVKNTNLYFANEQVKSSFSTLLEVFALVSSELDLDNLIKLIMVKAAEITRADRSSLFFMDETNGELWTKYAKGLGSEVVRTKKGIVKMVAENKQPQIINDPYNHPSFDPSIDIQTGYKTNSILSVPVFNSDGTVLGVIQVINKEDGIFTEKDLSILKGFASQISIAIENAKLFNEIYGMKNYLSILVDNLDNGIVTVDKFCTIQTANGVFSRMFNLDAKEIIQNKTLENLNNGLQCILAFNRHTIATGEKHYQHGLEIQTNASKKVTVNLSVLPMQDQKGDIIGAINVFYDITTEKRIRSNLSRYMPHHLIKEVISNDDLSVLKGNYGQCTVLFSDIRNFTTLTEQLGAIQIVELLNKFFNTMVGSIHANNGIIDKFIGDAIMAVFGVPYPNKLDAFHAIKCALDMFKMLNEFNKLHPEEPSLNIGIGIGSGNVVSGHIGSEKRFEYTVVGDPVNVAARLESLTKEYKTNLLICENTHQQIQASFHCREIDTILLKGKQRPIKIYSVIDYKDQPLSPKFIEFCKSYEVGLSCFYEMNFKAAQENFRRAYLLNENDGPTQFFLERCCNVSTEAGVESSL